MNMPQSTIFALASAPGRSGIAVLRLSGPAATQAIGKLCRPKILPKPREAVLRKIHHVQTSVLIDCALVIFFPAPQSYTGEDVVEFHVHGGRAVINALTESLYQLNFQLAEPGAFTRRAFENGKMDLTEAEAVADLVNAECEAQRRQAMRQLEGDLGKLYETWRAHLTKALAHLEAEIDFSDEELPKDIARDRLADVRGLSLEIKHYLDDRHRGERLREGFTITILGPPNVGKSSLLNTLAKREAAIVSEVAGTTRDVIEVHLDLGGYPITLVDTAGLRESVDKIESEGVRRALARAGHADFKLLVFDGEHWPKLDEATRKLMDDNALVIVNKADLISESNGNSVRLGADLFIATKTGEGIEALLDRLVQEIDLRFANTGQPPLTRLRHRAALEECVGHLNRALVAAAPELCVEDIRLASRALGHITGHIDVEDLLDIIFRDFCIGK